MRAFRTANGTPNGSRQVQQITAFRTTKGSKQGAANNSI